MYIIDKTITYPLSELFYICSQIHLADLLSIWCLVLSSSYKREHDQKEIPNCCNVYTHHGNIICTSKQYAGVPRLQQHLLGAYTSRELCHRKAAFLWKIKLNGLFHFKQCFYILCL